jgi:transposase
MASRITKKYGDVVKPYRLEDYDFAALAKAQSNKKLYQRLMILAHLKQGMPKAQISQLLFISTDQIYAWLKRFHEQGIEGLKDQPRSGRPRLLHRGAHEELKQQIEDSQSARSGGRLQGKDILELIKDEWGVTYSLSGIYYLMKDIGMSWVSTRSRHPKQDEQAQTDFKKTLPN